MPWAMLKNGNKYSVVNVKTGRLSAKATTKAKAQAQVRLLESIRRRTKGL